MKTTATLQRIMMQALNANIERHEKPPDKAAEQASIPKTLLRKVRRLLKRAPTLAWDDALTNIAKDAERNRQGR